MSTRSMAILGGLLVIGWKGAAGAPSISAGRTAPIETTAVATPAADWIEPELDSLPVWEEEPEGQTAAAYVRVDREPASLVPELKVILLLGLAIAGFAAGRQLMD